MKPKSMKEKMRLLIKGNTTRFGRSFDYFIQFLILLSLISFSIETLPKNSNITKQFLFIIELFCVIIFSIEYVLRIYVAKNPLRYVLSFYGIIDLLAILPFYFRVSFDLRAIRIFRVFMVFRALKLIRYNKALHRFHHAAKIVKEEMVLFFVVTGILIFLSASGIYFLNMKHSQKHLVLFSIVFGGQL